MAEQKFMGFEHPTKNWFPMPNNWTDITAGMESLAELKVVEYVLRHTWGYHEFGIAKTISTDEFMYGRRRTDGSRMDRGTGLKSDRSVKDGLKLAIQHGYLICERDESDQGRVKKSYRLNMTQGQGGYNLPPVDTTPGSNDGKGVESATQGGSIYPSGMQNLPIWHAKSTHRSEKETREIHLRKIWCISLVLSSSLSAKSDPSQDSETRIRTAIAQASLRSEGNITEEMFAETIALLGGQEDEPHEVSTHRDHHHPGRDTALAVPAPADEDLPHRASGSQPAQQQQAAPPSRGNAARPQQPSRATDVDPVAPAKKAKVELTDAQKTLARSLKMKIEDRCGVLPTGGPNIAENKAIATLVQRYPESDIDDVIHYLSHCHWKWSKDEHKYQIRGNIILQEIEPTLKLFAEKPHLRDATSPPVTNRTPYQQQSTGIVYQHLPPVPPHPRAQKLAAAAAGGVR